MEKFEVDTSGNYPRQTTLGELIDVLSQVGGALSPVWVRVDETGTSFALQVTGVTTSPGQYPQSIIIDTIAVGDAQTPPRDEDVATPQQSVDILGAVVQDEGC